MFESDHWLAPTATDPASRLHAWSDLLQMATYKPRQTRDPDVNLERGQFVASLRTLADRWHWHYSTARRFLEELKKRSAVATVRETHIGTIYTIVNYETYAVDGEQERNSERNADRNSGETAANQELEGKQLSRKKTSTSAGRRWRVCPADWTGPTEAHRALAQSLGLDVGHQELKFRNYTFRSSHTDADSTFRNWLVNSKDRPMNGNGHHHRQPKLNRLPLPEPT